MAADESFPLIKPQEDEGFDLTQTGDKQRHLRARDRNYLLVPFQGDLCYFRNLTNRDSGKSEADEKLVVSIRRSNLDTFWARKPDTVGVTRKEEVKIRKLSDLMGLSNLFSSTGTFPLEETMEIGISVCMLQRSSDKGRYWNNIQFEAVIKLRAAHWNIWLAPNRRAEVVITFFKK